MKVMNTCGLNQLCCPVKIDPICHGFANDCFVLNNAIGPNHNFSAIINLVAHWFVTQYGM